MNHGTVAHWFTKTLEAYKLLSSVFPSPRISCRLATFLSLYADVRVSLAPGYTLLTFMNVTYVSEPMSFWPLWMRQRTRAGKLQDVQEGWTPFNLPGEHFSVRRGDKFYRSYPGMLSWKEAQRLSTDGTVPARIGELQTQYKVRNTTLFSLCLKMHPSIFWFIFTPLSVFTAISICDNWTSFEVEDG